MKIEIQNYNNVTVVELQGEFTEETAKSLQDTAGSLIATGSADIVLDMSNISFVDSIALEQLLWLNDYCGENNGQLKLAGLDENCTKIMEITRLEPHLDIYIELAQAVKSYI